MKPIKTMKQASSGLKSFIDQLPAGELGSWEEFRNHNAGKSYKELISELISLQRGLCGYCEIDLVELDQEVEHIIPKSDPKIGKKYALDHLNLMACCKGGSSIKRNQVARYKEPVKMNLSCGASKLDEVITSFVDPRSLSAIAFVTKSNSSGKLVADYENCKSAGIDVQSVNDTIEFLNLNVNRLVLARRKIWESLGNSWAEHLGNFELIESAIEKELLPDERGNLRNFFTTRRSYFAPIGNLMLKNRVCDWL